MNWLRWGAILHIRIDHPTNWSTLYEIKYILANTIFIQTVLFKRFSRQITKSKLQNWFQSLGFKLIRSLEFIAVNSNQNKINVGNFHGKSITKNLKSYRKSIHFLIEVINNTLFYNEKNTIAGNATDLDFRFFKLILRSVVVEIQTIVISTRIVK